MLAEDERYFLHQSLSTPCLNAICASDGIYLQDMQGRRIMDFHGNSAHQVGHGHPRVVEAIKKAAEAFSVPRIACLGLAYKADIDDLRESPAVKIVKSLALDRIGEVLIVEPHIRALPEELKNLSGLKLVEMDAALDRSGIVVLLVDHQPFKAIDRARLQGKVVIDTRGVWR